VKNALVTTLLLGSFGCVWAEDWSEWRGPSRNGVLKDSPALLDRIEGDSLPLLWEIPLPPGNWPKYSSPVGAAGRAYLHISPGDPPVAAAATPPPPPAPKPDMPAAKVGEESPDIGAVALDAPQPAPKPTPPPTPRGPPAGGLDDVLLCVDTASGKEAWRFKEYGGPSKLGAPNTPCIRDGRLYFVGNFGKLYCLHAETGAKLWDTDAFGSTGNYSASPLVVAGRVVIVEKKMLAFDAATGAKTWEAGVSVGDSSPTLWRHGGKDFILTGAAEIACVDAATGAVAWRAPGNKTAATPVAAGEWLVQMLTYANPLVFRISPTLAEPVEGFDIRPAGMGHQACTPAMVGSLVYVWDAARTQCYDLEKRAMVWEGEGPGDGKPSPILADGKILANNTRRLLVLDATTGKTLYWANVTAASCTSVALLDGKLLVNAGSHFRCYRLAKP
jgi:outer membrane protein assembly factor BamB